MSRLEFIVIKNIAAREKNKETNSLKYFLKKICNDYNLQFCRGSWKLYGWFYLKLQPQVNLICTCQLLK